MGKILKMWIYILFFISIIVFVLVTYKKFFVYNIVEKNPLVIIQDTMENKYIYNIDINKIKIIDKCELNYGRIFLFKTGLESRPIGYITLEKNPICDTYKVDRYKLYNSYNDCYKYANLLKTYDNIYTFKFIDSKICLLSKKSILVSSVLECFIAPVLLLVGAVFIKKTYIGKI